ncbi:MAG: hypothetical protein HY548_05785 [Elusimicrobia bacterium]|nr:hypothetical protein [Elusimicrobiota bacterium]
MKWMLIAGVLARGPVLLADDVCQDTSAVFQQGQAVAMQGEILDMTCYLSHEGMGEAHRTCAKACLSEGGPIGLLAEDGSVYLLLKDHSNSDAYAVVQNMGAEQAKVTGKLFARGSMQAIVINKVKKAK